MRFTSSGVGLCLIAFGFTQEIRAQNQLPNSATPPAANSTATKSNTSQSNEGLSDVKILLPGDPAAIPAAATESVAEPSLYLKGLMFLETGNNAEAVETLRQAVERDPNDAAAYGKLGVAYAALGQYKEAVVVLKLAIRIKPEIVDAEDYYQLSRAYTALEKFPQALEAIKFALYIKRAEQVNPESGNNYRAPSMADLHYSAGLAFYNLQRYRDAIEELKQVIALNPNHAPGHFGLTLTYLVTGDRKAAEKQQQALESLDPVYAAKIAKLLAVKSDNHQGLVFIFKASP
jgi:tetratricopeptide (TPR) repeat protein